MDNNINPLEKNSFLEDVEKNQERINNGEMNI
jgi:hypothetical protein